MLSKHDFSLDNFLQSKMSGNVLVCGEMKSHFLLGGGPFLSVSNGLNHQWCTASYWCH